MGSHHGNSVSKKSLQTVNAPPSSSPAEVLRISPESLEIANAYLQYQSLPEVSKSLGIPPDLVSQTLDKREVRAYIDNVFMDYGFNNRFKVRGILDEVIKRKLQEMDENDLGSEKDIVDILALSHKMSMDILDRQIKLEAAKAANIKNQTNVQINGGGGSQYESLMERLIKSEG